MSSKCSIIMYHYVRELNYTRYPEIKGITVSLFKEQIAYMQKYYSFICHTDLINAIYNEMPLPRNAAWLTFDDGYMDHYENVFPILNELGIQGAFFPPAKAIIEHTVLDVNKIHFIIANTKDFNSLIKEIYNLLDRYRQEYNLNKNEDYYSKLAVASRFDNKDVIFVKRLLQVELPEELRKILTSILFREYVSDNEEVFSRELYMNTDQIKCMNRNGMYIGSHGYDHYWLDSLNPCMQESEIEKSLEFLQKIGSDTSNWIMNYPYGGWNQTLIAILKRKNCKFALTTNTSIANVSLDNAFTLERLDTNDLPKDRNAPFKLF